MKYARLLFSTNPLTEFQGTALLILRLVAGLAFILHGWPKIQNPFTWMGPDAFAPGVFLALAALSEFGGGIALILGLLTRIASLGIASTMIVAVYFHAVLRGDSFVGKPGEGSYELALVYAAVACLLIVTGPGRISLDRIISDRLGIR
jgi:putative oxidoreductase